MNPHNDIRAAVGEALVLLGSYGPQNAFWGDGLDLDSIDEGRLKELAGEASWRMRRVLDGLPRGDLTQHGAGVLAQFSNSHGRHVAHCSTLCVPVCY